MNARERTQTLLDETFGDRSVAVRFESAMAPPCPPQLSVSRRSTLVARDWKLS